MAHELAFEEGDNAQSLEFEEEANGSVIRIVA